MALTLSEPNAGQWWVANCQNTLRWVGARPGEFSVYICHPDPEILSERVPLTTHQPLYLYYKMITPIGFTPACGYILQLTNVSNSLDIYSTSEPFEIKRPGSRRSPPPPSVRPISKTRDSKSSTASIASTTVSASRTTDGKTTHLTFEYGGAYVAGVHAAGLLCEGFKEMTLKEVEEGSGDGWIRLGEPAPPRRGGKFLIGKASSASGSLRPPSTKGEPVLDSEEVRMGASSLVREAPPETIPLVSFGTGVEAPTPAASEGLSQPVQVDQAGQPITESLVKPIPRIVEMTIESEELLGLR